MKTRIMKTKVLMLALMLSSTALMSQNLPSATEIVQKTQNRDDGKTQIQNVKLELISKSGKTRVQSTTAMRKDFEGERKSAIFYTYPSNVKGTAFLLFDYEEAAKDDDQWLYLPAMRKTRRISAANRGDYFLGTDLTYEDIKLGTKLSDEDYNHKTIDVQEIDGHKCYLIESFPIDEKTKKELGYSKVHAWVDANLWMVRKGVFWDIAGNKLKTVEVKDIKLIENIWSPLRFEVENHKNGHKTNFIFSEIEYLKEVEDEIFTEQSLVRGL